MRLDGEDRRRIKPEESLHSGLGDEPCLCIFVGEECSTLEDEGVCECFIGVYCRFISVGIDCSCHIAREIAAESRLLERFEGNSEEVAAARVSPMVDTCILRQGWLY